LESLVEESWAVLVDGHHPDLADAAVRAARRHGSLCLLAGRDWTKITPRLLSFADIAVCSTSSHVRNSRRRIPKDVLGYLLDCGVPRAVVTDGPRPVKWASQDHGVQPDISVLVTEVVDTQGADGVFSGALMHAITRQPLTDDDFAVALQFAADVATYSCLTFGTRAWMESWPRRPHVPSP
jgi:sugar/nucleoside kinase (ribokinase family)